MPRFLHELLSLPATARPEGIAVCWKEDSIPYSELDRLTNQIAHTLRAHGCQCGDRVAVLIPNSANALFATLGIWKAGCVVVPIDVTTPAARVAEILCECRPSVILAARFTHTLLDQLFFHDVSPASVATLEAMPIEGEYFATDFSGFDVLRESFEPLVFGATPHAPALLFFGSGELACDAIDAARTPLFDAIASTPHRPTVVSHTDVFAFLASSRRGFALTEFDRVAGLPFQSPIVVAETLAALAAGAELHIVPQELLARPRQLVAFVRSRELTEWLTNHGTLSELIHSDEIRDGDLPSLKRLLWSGTALPTETLHELMQRLPLTQFARVVESAGTKVGGPVELIAALPEPEPPSATDEPMLAATPL